MIGLNASTGRAVRGLAHLYQSIAQILTTPIGSRLARRDFGSELPDLIDAPNHGATRLRLYTAVATALVNWEPRLKLRRVQLAQSTQTDAAGLQRGEQVIEIEGTSNETGEPALTRVSLGARERGAR